MSADEDALLAALGGGDGTLVDQLDAALTVAWELAAGLNLTLPTSGGSPGPYRPGGTSWDLAYDQTCARWGTAPKARTMTEKAALLEQLVRGIDAHRATPTPVGALPAGTTQGTLTWAADLTKADVVSAGFKSTPWNTETGPSWPPPIAAAPDGRRSIKFALGTGGKRIEVEPNCRTFPKGDDAWFGFSVLFDTGFPLSVNDWWVTAQLHGNDTTSPQQCIQVRQGQFHIADNHAFGPQLVTGHRYRVVMHASMDPRGTTSVWVDDQLVCNAYQAGLNATPLYWKTGSYKDPSTAGGTLYQADHALGTGYGAVRPQ